MTKATRWALVISAVASTGVGLVLLFLLSVATSNRGVFEQHYVWLFWVNVTVAGLLLLVIGIAGLRLASRLRRRKFGSQLLFKLAAIFALVGVIPGALIYTVSFQFVSRSIETWFDARVDSALEAGLNLGRSTLDAQATELAVKTRVAAERIGESSSSLRLLDLERLREQLAVQELVVVGASGQVLQAVGASDRVGRAVSLNPERPPVASLRQARQQRVISQVDGLDEDGAAAAIREAPAATAGAGSARIRTIAYIPSSSVALGTEERYLMAVQSLSPTLIANALSVQGAYREYQQRALAREGLKRMYIGTLTLTLVLAVFAAFLLAVALGNQIARPLLLLADGVQQVTQGDLSAKPVFASNDELGGLTRSFADMTEQLADARNLVQRSVSQVESARANLQTILDNLTAGVIVFDAQGRIDTVNPGATRIVRQPMSAYRGQSLSAVPGLADFADAVTRRFEQHRSSPEAGERDHWQDSFELWSGSPGTSPPMPPAAGAAPPARPALTLLMRGAAMPHGARLLVFDDISDVVSAQRVQAWSEVARRVAHEIKNPLTPIQLSAERLQHRLESKLEPPDQAMLARSVGTIVAQVQAMKTLVNEFRDYARLPTARLAPLDLNALCTEVIGLYGHATEAAGSGLPAGDPLRVHLADRLPLIQGDSTQLRQVIHNLLQNAFDAVADHPHGRVELITESIHDEQGVLRGVRLRVCDNGPGIAQAVLQRAFEPYVTTKTKGTGLGLAVVKKIADEHGARIRLTNLPPASGSDAAAGGAQVSLSFSNFVAAEGRV
jgi:nitrogen fixation/metabolism regulation signal transduction histidine kinase